MMMKDEDDAMSEVRKKQEIIQHLMMKSMFDWMNEWIVVTDGWNDDDDDDLDQVSRWFDRFRIGGGRGTRRAAAAARWRQWGADPQQWPGIAAIWICIAIIIIHHIIVG